jgi:hypothetical protein
MFFKVASGWLFGNLPENQIAEIKSSFRIGFFSQSLL